jgi:hypothetical protein
VPWPAIDKRAVVVDMRGHARDETIAAVYDCLHRSYVVYTDAPVSGTVTTSDETRTAEQLEDKLLDGTPGPLMHNDGPEVVEILQRPSSFLDKAPR